MRRPRGTLAGRTVSKSYGETLVLDRVSLAGRTLVSAGRAVAGS
jgi:hypothetical protein